MPEDTIPGTNVYDMRLTRHEDGWVYGLFCVERHDDSQPGDLSAATATCGIARTRDLVNWERLPDLKCKSQQRNVVLHPEFVDGKYNLSTVVTHKTSDWSVIALDRPVDFIWIKAVRRLDAVEIFYSLMIRNII